MPKPVGFCLYQEAADPYEVRKPAQVSHHYVAYACIFFPERQPRLHEKEMKNHA
jgi:hypothetical protein